MIAQEQTCSQGVIRLTQEAIPNVWKRLQNGMHAARIIVGLMAMYLHLGPFSRRVIAAIDRRIERDVVAPIVGPVAIADLGATA